MPLTAPVHEGAGRLPEHPPVSDEQLRSAARALASTWRMTRGNSESQPGADSLPERMRSLKARLADRLKACERIANPRDLTPPLELLESTRALEAVLQGMKAAIPELREQPYVLVAAASASSNAPGAPPAQEKALKKSQEKSQEKSQSIPRVMNLAEGYLVAAQGIWSAGSLTTFVQAAESHDDLRLGEILLLPAALKIAQLEYLLDRADEVFVPGRPVPDIEHSPFSAPLHSLRRLGQFEWPEILEPLVPFQSILAQDPSGTFAAMEEETRYTYRLRVAELAAHSDASEREVATAALALARAAAGRPHSDPRLAHRLAHIGYYLVDSGFAELSHKIGYHPPFADRLRTLVHNRGEDLYILGIFMLSLLLIVALIAPLVPHSAFPAVIFALFLALLPATQGAADLVNNIVTAILKARALPKLNLEDGIPLNFSTLVVVPTLLLNEHGVREMFEDLEARYLANQDPHLHFSLLTDLPDSEARPEPEEQNPLVQLAVRLTDDLNRKYAGERGGAFLLLHRHRVFNARQGAWMGWERKRGKLLDLNKYILESYDSFPTKAGPTEVLHTVRFVITLDSDTQLPRGTAARMIGTMAHPLNQAIIDPELRVVTLGYGILQPRVGVSVSSAARSRLAALYSGETGFDIYTRAVSDVYQDLFGEGIFTGKGIYEVSVLHQVLDRRFPRNALLSHDLIEGAYARAGLVTDIEVIDDYPSHHSAHTRRKHRWVRGDWQIVQWLSSHVPDESGQQVPNPINTVSRWKIFDNLRRSLVEPVTFLLLVCGWFFLPGLPGRFGGARYWTVVTLILLLLPTLVQLLFNLGRAALKFSPVAALEGLKTFGTSLFFAVLNFAFLPHQTLLAIDAIGRSLTRRFVTGKRLLEWETAAQSEAGRKSSQLDRYLQISPLVSAVIALLLWIAPAHRGALLAAAPILVLWALAPAIAAWLNSSPRRELGPLSAADRDFLEEQLLSTWRYFADFGGEANHFLIPDNVEEKDTLQIRKLSPTNLGMLFNARQAALEFGLLTPAEFTDLTLGTFRTYDRLEKHRGHIFNWYDIETLSPINPKIVSAVDSGNLMASLYSLHGGALDLLKQPILSPASFAGLRRLLRQPATGSAEQGSDPKRLAPATEASVAWLLRLPATSTAHSTPNSTEARRVEDAAARQRALLRFVHAYTPWLHPRFCSLRDIPQFEDPAHRELPSLQHAPDYARHLITRCEATLAACSVGSDEHNLASELHAELTRAVVLLDQLVADTVSLLEAAEHHAHAMDYSFLLVESRQLLSIGFDANTGELFGACYDLLASEARIAFFLAVAKGDIPQQSWFRLDRSHVLVHGHASLLSWTGTMFEFLMPALWMRAFPNTLISRTIASAIAIQRSHVRNIPWGISESGFGVTDPAGRYGYQAWGIPQLALKYGAEDGPVISPYSTFLALPFARQESIRNLRRMAELDWSGTYGMIEAADFSGRTSAPSPSPGNDQPGSRRKPTATPILVRSWMAHHQGMSLLALTNVLRDNLFQHWFHANARVRAAELLLHERPLSKETLKTLQERNLPSASPSTQTDQQAAVA